MGTDRIYSVDSYPFGSMVFGFLYGVYKDRQEFAIIKPKLILDVEYDWNETLKQLLLSLKVLFLKDLYDFIGDPFNLLIEDFVRAIDYDLSQASYSSSMLNFISWLF